MNGRRTLASGRASLTTNLAWQVAGIGDFDGDGRDDVLLRHEDGRWHYYRMNGRRTLASSGRASLTSNLAWQMAGVGDFDGDGRADVLLRHDDGRWYFYPMNGRAPIAGRGGVSLTQDLAWGVAGMGDFDADGRHDVLLRHTDGRWRYYPMNGRAVRSGGGAANLTGNTTISVVGIGDMNGDGRADVLMRRADGRWHYYPMNGRRSISGRGEASLPTDAAWTVAAPAPSETVDGLHIATDARSLVQPLQSVSLTLRGAATDANYDILLDLSGARGFSDDDTIEVAPVKTAAGQLLFAAPLPETLAEGNAARRIAVRVRERAGDADATLSNTLMLTLGETGVPAEFAGHPTVMMDVVLKAVYEGLDDPLLTVEAAAIEPGRSVHSARTLGLSTAYSDAQAQAMLQSLFGVSLGASGAGGQSSSRTAASGGRTAASVRCEFFAGATLCNAYRRAFDCVGDALSGSGGDDMARCGRIIKEDAVEAWLARTEKIRSFGNILRGAAPRLARFLGAGRRPAQVVHDLNAAVRQGVGMNKTFRTVIDRAEGLEMTVRERAEALGQSFEAMRDATRTLTEPLPERIAETEREAGAEGLEGDKREAHYAIVEEGDHHYRDAAAFETETMEDVYTGETDVVEALGTASDGSPAVCGAGYEEFSVDDKTSTCVLTSLVEPNCYAGSRQVNHPALGGANACLYYSLDYIQPDGTCRENYAKVTYQGRETCRWAELETDRSAWYTLEKEHGVESPQHRVRTYPSSCDEYTQRNWGISFREYGQRCLGFSSGGCCQVCSFSVWAFCASCEDFSDSGSCRYYPAATSPSPTVELTWPRMDPIHAIATKRRRND